MNDEVPIINSEAEFHELDDETKQKLLKTPEGREDGVHEAQPKFGDANA